MQEKLPARYGIDTVTGAYCILRDGQNRVDSAVCDGIPCSRYTVEYSGI